MWESWKSTPSSRRSLVFRGSVLSLKEKRSSFRNVEMALEKAVTAIYTALAFLLPSKIPKIKITIVSEKLTLRKNVSHNVSFDTESCLNSLSLDISRVFAWNVCGLSLSILRCDLSLTNRFYLVTLKKLTESISISGELEKNQMKKLVAYLQKLFHSI